LKSKLAKFSHYLKIEDKLIFSSSPEAAKRVLEAYQGKLPSLTEVISGRENEDIFLYFNIELLVKNILPIMGIFLKSKPLLSPFADIPTSKELGELWKKQKLQTIITRIKDIKSLQARVYLEEDELGIKGILQMANPPQGSPQALNLLTYLPPRAIFALNSLAYQEETFNKTKKFFTSLKEQSLTLPPEEKEKAEQELAKLESKYLTLTDNFQKSFADQVGFALISSPQNTTPDLLGIFPLKNRKGANRFINDLLSLKLLPPEKKKETQISTLGVEKYKGRNIFGYKIQSSSNLFKSFLPKEFEIYYTLTPDCLIVSRSKNSSLVKRVIDLQGKEDNFYKNIFLDFPSEVDGKLYCSLSQFSRLIISKLGGISSSKQAGGSISQGSAGVWKASSDQLHFEGYVNTKDLKGVLDNIKTITK